MTVLSHMYVQSDKIRLYALWVSHHRRDPPAPPQDSGSVDAGSDVTSMYDTLQPCDALWKVRTRRAQSVFWRCEHADEVGPNPRIRPPLQCTSHSANLTSQHLGGRRAKTPPRTSQLPSSFRGGKCEPVFSQSKNLHDYLLIGCFTHYRPPVFAELDLRRRRN